MMNPNFPTFVTAVPGTAHEHDRKIIGPRFGPPAPLDESELAQWADDGGNNLD